MNGILLIDKPQGWSSFDVVNSVRKKIASAEGKRPKQVKVGHTGTLDPLASGLLVLLVGEYTKRAQEFTKLDKTYRVTMKLGMNSSTGDEEGDKSAVSDRQPTSSEIKKTTQNFTGEILQKPPVYSAVKINGQRAYKLARQGMSLDLEPRKVTILRINIENYNYPLVELTTDVSSGTYIRSLVCDIGMSLKTGAYMSALRRTRVGQYELKNAIKIDDDSLLSQIFA